MEKHAPKVHAKQPANRCPYCHDEVRREEAVACRDCLARHHDACWSEGTGCSACSCTVRLETQAHVKPPLSPKVVGDLLAEHGYSRDELREFLGKRSSAPGLLLKPLLFLVPVFVFGAAAFLFVGIYDVLGGIVTDTPRTSSPYAIAFVIGAIVGFLYSLVSRLRDRG